MRNNPFLPKEKERNKKIYYTKIIALFSCLLSLTGKNELTPNGQESGRFL